MYLSAFWRILERMHSGTTWRLGHRPALDGLRGVAILFVMVSHAVPMSSDLRVLGTTGVTLFFTLSGFLITRGLIDEHARTGRIGLGSFWRRRVRRLGPALVVFLAVMLVAAPFIEGLAGGRAALAALFNVANWAKAFEWCDMGQIGPAWSLSIEEQFYVLWPLTLVLLCRSRRWRALVYGLAGVAAVYALAARIVLLDGGHGYLRIYFGTDTRMDALLIGCALAVHCARRPPAARALAADLILIGATAFVIETSSDISDVLLTPTIIAFAAAGSLWLSIGDGYRGVLSNRWLRLVGQRSYGLYLWHLPLLYVAATVAPEAPRVVTAAVGFAAAWGFAALSWRHIEEPFLRRRVSSSRRPVVATPAAI